MVTIRMDSDTDGNFQFLYSDDRMVYFSVVEKNKGQKGTIIHRIIVKTLQRNFLIIF